MILSLYKANSPYTHEEAMNCQFVGKLGGAVTCDGDSAGERRGGLLSEKLLAVIIRFTAGCLPLEREEAPGGGLRRLRLILRLARIKPPPAGLPEVSSARGLPPLAAEPPASGKSCYIPQCPPPPLLPYLSDVNFLLMRALSCLPLQRSLLAFFSLHGRVES